ncbi:class I SAM-dependent methyltransferase [Haloferula sargassicola]|uniref:Ribosomal RNA small subunit methyltransferase H n=1 Tax=Haloferula sargassicola TaxID=490096 RepID=A0ABP9UNY5_9BACT
MTKRATVRAHEVVMKVVREGDVVIDATAGNGHDTVFLAARIGESGKVVAFDVQAAAIESARARVEAAGFGKRVEFFCESHAAMADRVSQGVAAVMFNLGYLPGADHGVITETGETLRALAAAVSLLKPGGVLTVVCYPGHAGGDEEAAAVTEWARNAGGEVFPAAREGAPFLVVVSQSS